MNPCHIPPHKQGPEHAGYTIGCCLVLPMRKHDVRMSGGAAATTGSTWYAKRALGGVAPKFLKVSQASPNKEAKSRK